MGFFRRGLTKIEAANLKIKILEQQLKIATTHLENISNGCFEIELNISSLDAHRNESKDFVNILQRSQSKLITLTKKDKEQIWVTQGVSKVMELISGDHHHETDFYNRILSLLVQYTEVNQGGIFIVNDEDENNVVLNLAACYAYGKRKFIDKVVESGQGMLGQCYLEKETRIFTQVPPKFTTITSGLGEATPTFLIMVPFKHNDEVLGVLELASFNRLKPYQIEFLEKTAETIASRTLDLKNSTKVAKLLAESKAKADLLQQKEETLKQNLEELVATQEEMQRNQNELNGQTHLLKFILDNIPFPVFVKDEAGRYSLVNKAEARLFDLDYTDVVGKNDSHFVSNEEEWKVIKESDEHVLASDQPFELPLQNFTTRMGTSYTFKTTKIPFINNVTGKKNILGVSIDLTEKLTLEKQLLQERKLSTMNMMINITGRQRMLSQKIGFYAESLLRGNKHHTPLLRDAIELHEHTLQVMRFGGVPMDVVNDDPLPPLEDALIPHLKQIEAVWALYKRAAENILNFTSLDAYQKSIKNVNDAEQSILVIESHGELLLKLNNELMLACLAQSEAQLELVY